MTGQNTAIVYYCYGNTSPIDIEYNPIISIASIRQFNKDIPIIVMICENNDNLYLPYLKQLNFKLYKFSARHPNNQLCYRVNDIFAMLKSTNYNRCINCDIDMIWSKDIKDFVSIWDASKKDYFIHRDGNTGVYGVTNNDNCMFKQAWCDLSELLAQCDIHNIQNVIKHYYPVLSLHDEVSLFMLRQIQKDTSNYVEYYNTDLICIPGYNKFVDNSFGIHYISKFVQDFFYYNFNHIINSRVGRTGLLLSIKEYYDMLKQELGNNFDIFIKYIPLLNKHYTLQDFLKKIEIIS